MSSGYQAVLKMEERIIQAYKALPKEILKYLSLQEWAPCFNENRKGHWKALSLYERHQKALSLSLWSSVAEWSGCRTWNLEIPNSGPALTTSWSSAALV